MLDEGLGPLHNPRSCGVYDYWPHRPDPSFPIEELIAVVNQGVAILIPPYFIGGEAVSKAGDRFLKAEVGLKPLLTEP